MWRVVPSQHALDRTIRTAKASIELHQLAIFPPTSPLSNFFSCPPFSHILLVCGRIHTEGLYHVYGPLWWSCLETALAVPLPSFEKDACEIHGVIDISSTATAPKGGRTCLLRMQFKPSTLSCLEHGALTRMSSRDVCRALGSAGH